MTAIRASVISIENTMIGFRAFMVVLGMREFRGRIEALLELRVSRAPSGFINGVLRTQLNFWTLRSVQKGSQLNIPVNTLAFSLSRGCNKYLLFSGPNGIDLTESQPS